MFSLIFDFYSILELLKRKIILNKNKLSKCHFTVIVRPMNSQKSSKKGRKKGIPWEARRWKELCEEARGHSKCGAYQLAIEHYNKVGHE